MATKLCDHGKGMRSAGISTRFFTERCFSRLSQRVVDRNLRFAIKGSDVVGSDRETAVTGLFAWWQESGFGERGRAL